LHTLRSRSSRQIYEYGTGTETGTETRTSQKLGIAWIAAADAVWSIMIILLLVVVEGDFVANW
jgi:hypothetical protein